MTKYAGEGYRVTAVPRDDDKKLIDDTMVLGLTLEIWDPDATKIVNAAAMVYDGVNTIQVKLDGELVDVHFWYYMLGTAGQPAGSYKGKATITGHDGRVNWEWLKFRLAADPIPTP